MRILVTGAAGFVGCALGGRLDAAFPDAAVTLFDRSAAEPTHHAVCKVVCGDLARASDRAEAVADGVDLVFHLAAVPGGAAQANYALSRAVNVEGTLALFEAAASKSRPRIVYASSIAVLGDPLPPMVDDLTPANPTLTYGAHKLMMEVALADLVRRGDVDGVSLRLPGIIARPQAASGLKSAFMSDVFYALRDGKAFTSPVSPDATMWMMSVERCVDNLVIAARADLTGLAPHRAVTAPAQRASMGALIDEIARQCGTDTAGVTYAPDATLERSFGAYPPLVTGAAESLGLTCDGSLESLVRRVLDQIA